MYHLARKLVWRPVGDTGAGSLQNVNVRRMRLASVHPSDEYP
jgi:hypothetical protein